MDEVLYTVYRPAAPGPWDVHMTVTHLPTGKSVQGSGRNQFKLREALLRRLEALVAR